MRGRIGDGHLHRAAPAGLHGVLQQQGKRLAQTRRVADQKRRHGRGDEPGKQQPLRGGRLFNGGLHLAHQGLQVEDVRGGLGVRRGRLGRRREPVHVVGGEVLVLERDFLVLRLGRGSRRMLLRGGAFGKPFARRGILALGSVGGAGLTDGRPGGGRIGESRVKPLVGGGFDGLAQGRRRGGRRGPGFGRLRRHGARRGGLHDGRL